MSKSKGGQASLAEMERDLMVERTRAGLDVARQLGRKGGRKPKMTASKMAHSTISHFRHLIRTLQYFVFTHATEELELLSSTLKTSSSRAKSSHANATAKPAKSSTLSPASSLTANQPKRSSKSASAANSLLSPVTSVEHHCEHCGGSAVQLKHVTRS